MTDLFKALGDETRLRILAQLLNGERCVCEIEAGLELTQSNASRHLGTLKRCGILQSRKQAQWTYYKMNPDFIKNEIRLYEYLKEELVTLPFYRIDKEKFDECRKKNICGC